MFQLVRTVLGQEADDYQLDIRVSSNNFVQFIFHVVVPSVMSYLGQMSRYSRFLALSIILLNLWKIVESINQSPSISVQNFHYFNF